MTFESQLLELLREYEEDRSKYVVIPDIEKVTLSMEDFIVWLSKRVEKEEECEHFIGAAGVCKCEAEKELKKEL